MDSIALQQELEEARARNRRRLAGILDHQDRVVELNDRPARFGQPFSDVVRVYAEAEGKCAICSIERSGKNHALDHDHKTGKLRGILCNNCNTGLGMFGDDPVRLRAAAEYLERHG